MTLMSATDSRHFRDVLGEYPTGVVVVAATHESGEALAMTIGTFTSVSLDPPLIAFLPSKSSASWSALRTAGNRFAVNILAEDQQEIGNAVSARKGEKLLGISWVSSPRGNPLIEGCTAGLECEVVAIHDGGDHDIVVAEVLELYQGADRPPLVFHRGSYAQLKTVADRDRRAR
jgi:flavin reductase (DIM6/NTAB) family NADH-FMN oxidoreductase RutF